MKLRRPLVSFLLLAFAGFAPAVSAADANDHAGFRQPGEFEPQGAVWLCADGESPEFKQATADMAKALLGHVPVKMIAETDAALAAAKTYLRAKGVDIDRIEFLVSPLDTYFMRDAAVYMVNGRGDLALLDLKWSDYGLPGWGQRLYPHEPACAAKVASHVNTATDGLEAVLAAPLKASLIPSSLFLENATFEVNGKGVLLISEPLALERNPGLTREQIEVQLRAIPGVEKVIWLAEGVAEDPEEISTIEGDFVGMGAGGHTDEFVRFVDASTIFLAWEETPAPNAHPVQRLNAARMAKNYEILTHATDQDGKPFRVIKVPQPAVVQQPLKLLGKDDQTSMWHNTAFPASEGRKEGAEVMQVASSTYLNFLIANDVVLVPSYVQDGTDPVVEKRVAQLFRDALPGRAITFIRCTPLNFHGGGIHCATLSEPKR